MRQKNQERFKVGEGLGLPFLALKIEEEGHEPKNEEDQKSS